MTSLRNRLVLLVAIVLPSVGCDQAMKELARSQLTPGVGTEHLGGILTLLLTSNRGAFLGAGAALPEGVREPILLYGVLAGLVALAAYLILVPLPRGGLAIGSLIVAGGFGNLIDRFSFHGQVTDFLLLRAGPIHTGIFNLADMQITFAAIALLVSAVWPKRSSQGKAG